MITEIITSLSVKMVKLAEVNQEEQDKLISYAIYQVDGTYLCCIAKQYIEFDDCSKDSFDTKILSTGAEMLSYFEDSKLTKRLIKKFMQNR